MSTSSRSARPARRTSSTRSRTCCSEIGIIYLSDFNKDVIGKMLREKHLEFHPLFRAPLHVFISRNNPLAGKKKVTMDDLEAVPVHPVRAGRGGQLLLRRGGGVAGVLPQADQRDRSCDDPELHHRPERVHGVHRHRQRRPATTRRSSPCRWTPTKRCWWAGSPTSAPSCRRPPRRISRSSSPWSPTTVTS